jgi:hypothetical protein
LDVDGNFSVPSDPAYGRPLTLDQGILVVDETQNWTSGNLPRDSTQDRYWDSLLVGYVHEQYEYGTTALRPVLSDFTPYSTVVWHGDDYTQLWASGDTANLRQYLDWGGKLWLAGWKPTGNVRSNAIYPASFETAPLVRNYFKLDSANLSGVPDSFQAAVGGNGYPNISVDPSKVPASGWGGTMRYIESYTLGSGAEAIYTIDMRNNTSLFEGLPCGVNYLGPSYKTAIFGFPLYFMEMSQARAAAQRVLGDFGETGVAGNPVVTPVIREFQLSPPRPNPFRQSTTVSYQIPAAGIVNLAIYNVVGQKVRTLVSGVQSAGSHQARWDGKSDSKRLLSAGLFFMRLEAGRNTKTKKLMLVK